MPISAKNRDRYPRDWPAISLTIRQRGNWRCEGSPLYPDCRAGHTEAHPLTGSRVVLTTAHLDHQPENCAPDNLRSWCQRCHLAYDREHHAATRAARRAWNAMTKNSLGVPNIMRLENAIARLEGCDAAIRRHD